MSFGLRSYLSQTFSSNFKPSFSFRWCSGDCWKILGIPFSGTRTCWEWFLCKRVPCDTSSRTVELSDGSIFTEGGCVCAGKCVYVTFRQLKAKEVKRQQKSLLYCSTLTERPKMISVPCFESCSKRTGAGALVSGVDSAHDSRYHPFPIFNPCRFFFFSELNLCQEPLAWEGRRAGRTAQPAQAAPPPPGAEEGTGLRETGKRASSSGQPRWQQQLCRPKASRRLPKATPPGGRALLGLALLQGAEPARTLTLPKPPSRRMRSRARFSVFQALCQPRAEHCLQGCAEETLSPFPGGWWPGDRLSAHPLHAPLPKAALPEVSLWRRES